MKKTILILIAILISPIIAQGETFYTDYYLKAKNIESYYEENELIKREEKNLYNNYKEVKINESYYELNKAPSNLKYLDKLDSKIKTNYTKTKSNNTSQEYITNLISKFEKARFIVLRNFLTTETKITSVNITYQGKEIDFLYSGSNYNINNLLTTSSKLIIQLDNQYLLKDLEIKVTFKSSNLNRIAFMLDVYEDEYKIGLPYMYFTNDLIRTSENEEYKINFYNKEDFQTLLKNISWIKAKDYASTKEVTYYKNDTTLYKYYNLTKKYLDEYTAEAIGGYILDKSDIKKTYTYYQRDLIEVKDEVNTLEELKNILITTTIPLDKIKMTFYLNIYQDKDCLLVIKYEDYIFYKKIKILNSEKIEEEIKNEEIIQEEIIEEKPLDNQITTEEIVNNENIQSEDNIKDNVLAWDKEVNNKDNKNEIETITINKNSEIVINTKPKVDKTTKKITSLVTKETTKQVESNQTKQNLKIYFIMPLIIIIIIFVIIMCKPLKNILKKNF